MRLTDWQMIIRSYLICFTPATLLCSHVLRQIVANAEGIYPGYHMVGDTQKCWRSLQLPTSLFIYAAYDFLQKNVMPSLRSVQRIVHSEYKTINEGQFRFDEPHWSSQCTISVGEDAISRVEYDHETDRCVGFVLPLNDSGLPEVDLFRSKQLKKCWANTKWRSTLTLARFGSDNLFKTPTIMITCLRHLP